MAQCLPLFLIGFLTCSSVQHHPIPKWRMQRFQHLVWSSVRPTASLQIVAWRHQLLDVRLQWKSANRRTSFQAFWGRSGRARSSIRNMLHFGGVPTEGWERGVRMCFRIWVVLCVRKVLLWRSGRKGFVLYQSEPPFAGQNAQLLHFYRQSLWSWRLPSQTGLPFVSNQWTVSHQSKSSLRALPARQNGHFFKGSQPRVIRRKFALWRYDRPTS